MVEFADGVGAVGVNVAFHPGGSHFSHEGVKGPAYQILGTDVSLLWQALVKDKKFGVRAGGVFSYLHYYSSDPNSDAKSRAPSAYALQAKIGLLIQPVDVLEFHVDIDGGIESLSGSAMVGVPTALRFESDKIGIIRPNLQAQWNLDKDFGLFAGISYTIAVSGVSVPPLGPGDPEGNVKLENDGGAVALLAGLHLIF